MNRMQAFILFLFLSYAALIARTPQRFVNMSHAQIDSLLTVNASKEWKVSDKIKIYSDYFLEMPYKLTCAGDGPYALYEPWPLVNFRQTNCMVLCEHVLALSISDSWDNFFNNLQQIRYKDGMIGMRTRNHYTMADWLPQNRWLLGDVTEKVGGNFIKSVTRTISHKKFFAGKGISDMRDVLPDRELSVDYIPFKELPNIENNLRNGDIAALIFAGKEDIFSAHMMIIVEEDGQKYIREAAMSKMTTLDTPYRQWVSGSRFKNGRYLGLAFMRVNEALNTPGKIIKPWEIRELKKNKK